MGVGHHSHMFVPGQKLIWNKTYIEGNEISERIKAFALAHPVVVVKKILNAEDYIKNPKHPQFIIIDNDAWWCGLWFVPINLFLLDAIDE